MMKKNLLALSSKRSIFFFFFSLLTLLTAAAVASAMNEDTERLLNFKASLANPSILQNWIPYEHPCNYSAVFCKSSHVTSIDLNSIPLSVEFRSVASFLLTLNYLESLSLKSTNLKGNISMPTGFQCGPLLSTLDLSRNSLTGPFTYISHLGSCSSLKSLNLSGNLLDSSVGSSKTGLHVGTLQLLDLSFNKMSGQWDQFLSGCGEMTVLSLKGNAVAGDVDVSSCSKLVHLDISSNNFSATIPKLGDCAAMEFLDLSTNKFTGEIGNALSVCSQLSFLNISVNHFSGSIPPLPTNNLQFLYLADNDFVGQVPPELVEACPTLVELDLSKNNFSGGLPHALSACTSLQSIDISNNNFSGELPGDILFSSMISLKTLIVSFNSFNGSLPNSVSKLTELETLDLNSNSLSGSIPSSLCQASLKVLYLQNNLLSGSIPTTLSNCSNLVSLDLSFNYLTGTIPSALGSLTKLRDMVFLLNQLEGEIPTELMYIQSLENLVLDYNFLTGNVPFELSNCTALNWISLSNNRLSGPLPGWFGQLSNLGILTLSNNSLSGPIPDELGDSRSLIWLDLNTNLLSGPIPSALFKHSGSVAVKIINDKRYAYIKTDGSKECHGAGNLLEFSGIRPEQLNRISTRNPCKFTPSVRVFNGMIHPTFKNNGSMILLDISHNFLSGSIPKEIGMLYYLQVLNLGSNNISGSIPPEIGDLKNLNVLDLSDNRLEGTIPQAISGCSMLSEANLSDNLLTGPIPLMGQLGTFSNSSYLNNSGLCGIPLPPCSVISASNRNSSHLKSHGKQASLARSIATSLLICLFCIFGLIFVAVKMRKMRREENSSLDVYVDSLSHSGAGHGNWTLTSTREALSINLSAFEKPLKKLTFADLLEATNGFHSNSLIGSGGFGNVYKAQLKDGSVVAIKKLIQVSGQGDREFTAEMETIGKIKNRNLVSLLGYCKVKEERLLVYEYMKYGSLEDVLHDSKKSGIKLDWTARRRIAIGAARGLAFLHHNCIPHIIHRDMKSSNVLIDENLDARVSDFGMARLMSAMDDTHLSVSTLAGTPGYVPPEYYQSFRCSTKGDVYSYGVVLLELLTGRRPTDSTDFGDNNLVGWVKHAKLRISDIFDPSLIKEDPGIKIELLQHLKVACACLDDRPWKRPTIVQVLAMFKEIQAGSGLDSVSTVNDDGVFCGVQMVEMNIKEVPEFTKH